MKLYDHKTLGGILLVAGTSIGAGMLALPITTGVGGFYSAASVFLLCFIYMLITLFLMLEVNLHEVSHESNIITMAKKNLGVFGAIIGWLAFLLLLYAVAAAYMSAGGSLLAKLIFQKGPTYQQTLIGIILFTTVFALIVYFGAWLVDYINRFMMLGLVVTYLALVIFVTPHVDVTNFSNGESKYLLAALPVVLLSFTSHIIVPSLRTYLKSNIPQLKKVLLIGSLVPLVFYLVWEFNILGVLPSTGLNSLETIAKGVHPVAGLTEALHKHLGIVWIAALVGTFSFFALITSFQAVMLSLIDFLSDGFQIKKTHTGRIKLLLITIVPPLVFAIYFPSGFVVALSYAGVFVAILYGILPPLMLWKIRYINKSPSEFTVRGGKPLLIIVLFVAVAVIFFQIAATLKWLPTLT